MKFLFRFLSLFALGLMTASVLGAAWWGTPGRSGLIDNFYYSDAVAIAPGANHELRLDPSGYVYSTGYNDYGQLGRTSSMPYDVVAGLRDVVRIAAGFQCSFAIRSDGTLWAWGRNTNGMCGVTGPDSITRATQVPGVANVVDVAVGRNHGLLLLEDGRVMAWGKRMGFSSADGVQTVPVLVDGLENVVSLAAGNDTSVFARADGAVLQAGWDNVSKVSRDLSLVSGLTNVRQVSAGEFHKMALKGTGSVYTWGTDDSGALGTGLAKSATPRVVSGITDVKQIMAAWSISVAIRDGGEVFAWGRNTGNMFVFRDASSSVPRRIPGLANVTRIAMSPQWWLDGSLSSSHSAYFYGDRIPLVLTCNTESDVVASGATVNGLVYLDEPAPAGGAVVHLVCDRSDVVMPESITVPEFVRQTTFPIKAPVLEEGGDFAFSATYLADTVWMPRRCKILRSLPAISGLSFDPPRIIGGESTVATITLDRPAPAGGATITIESGRQYQSCPSSATVPEGKLEVQFTIKSKTQASSVSQYVSLSYRHSSLSGTLYVERTLPTLVAFEVLTKTARSGQTIPLRIALNRPAAAGGALIPLGYVSVSGPKHALVPPAVTMPAGEKEHVFQIPSAPGAGTEVFYITCDYGWKTNTANITLTPTFVKSVTISPSKVYGGQYVTVSVRLYEALTEEQPLAVSLTPGVEGPSSITIPQGTDTYDFQIYALPRERTGHAWIVVDGFRSYLTIGPSTLKSVQILEPSAVGGNTVHLRAVLNGPAMPGTTLTLATEQASLIDLPSTYVVPTGAFSVDIPLATRHPEIRTLVIVRVTCYGRTREAKTVLTPR